jgi:hypothetical protein
MQSVRIPGFSPNAFGFRFANDFPKVPVIKLPVPGMDLGLGDASNGLCGGMSLAAADLYTAGKAPPADQTAPSEGPLFDYLVQRAFDSFELPDGPMRYLMWMGLPDQEALFGIHGVVRRTIMEEWPEVRADIDAGKPSALGLIRTRSFNPHDLALNHQVLAYGYDLDDVNRRLTAIHVYDPNYPADGTVAISVHREDTPEASTFSYVEGDHPVRGFFRTAWTPKDPSAIAQPAPPGAEHGP